MFKRFTWSPESNNRNNYTRQFEPVQPFLFLSAVAKLKCTRVFDVGANVGVYGLFASALPTVSHVYLFEAEQTAFDEMLRNIAANNVKDKLDARCVAVSDSVGEISFGVAGPMSGANGVVATSIHNSKLYNERRTVPAVTLDSLFSFTDERLAFKIDVEGHEASVLAGGQKLMRDNSCVIQVEIYKGQEGLVDLLVGWGYRKLFRAGPDHYFSNSNGLGASEQAIEVMEEAFESLIHYNLKG